MNNYLEYKKFELKSVIKYIYELSKTEVNVINAIISERKTIKEIAKECRKDRTTIQKIIKEIFQKGIIKQDQVNLDRGFCYVYQIKKEVFDELYQKLEEDFKNKLEILKNIKQNFV